MVEDLNDGRAVADLATRVRPLAEPTFLLSAVRNDVGFWADRYSGCAYMELRPPIMDPIM